MATVSVQKKLPAKSWFPSDTKGELVAQNCFEGDAKKSIFIQDYSEKTALLPSSAYQIYCEVIAFERCWRIGHLRNDG